MKQQQRTSCILCKAMVRLPLETVRCRKAAIHPTNRGIVPIPKTQSDRQRTQRPPFLANMSEPVPPMSCTQRALGIPEILQEVATSFQPGVPPRNMLLVSKAFFPHAARLRWASINLKGLQHWLVSAIDCKLAVLIAHMGGAVLGQAAHVW